MSSRVNKTYTFHFVVRAKSWDGVIASLKDELDITKKQNSSDRRIDGLYLVSCVLDESKLTKDFYRKVASSENIAIHSDDKSASLYPIILAETQQVEERLRWLLLHVSDAIEDYARLLGYEKNDIVEANKLDPLTSRLSFEALLGLLEIDQSWARDGIDDNKMRMLLDDSSDFEGFKQTYLAKTAPKTVWQSISELVLQRPVQWDIIAPQLKSIKGLRNKCAHFHTVTDRDVAQVKHLRVQIMQQLTKKQHYSAADFQAFVALNKQLAETIKTFSESYRKNMTSLFESTNTVQSAMQKLAMTYKPIDTRALTDSLNGSLLNTGLEKSESDSEDDENNEDEDYGATSGTATVEDKE